MKTIIVAAAMLFALPALAEQPAKDEPGNAAVNTAETPQPAAPVKGANSFTEAQAAERIAEKGFTDVKGLAKDNDGIWRGKANRNGKAVDVSLDFQGNVFPATNTKESK
jgi:hypothetical protein